MSKRTLAIDFDGCLTGNEYECKIYSEYLGKKFDVSDLKDYNLYKLGLMSISDENKMWEERAIDFYKNVEPDEIAIKNIFKIAEDFDEVIILTKRFNYAYSHTVDWLNKYKHLGINYDKLVLTNDLKKNRFIMDLQVTHLIEDNGYLTSELKDKVTTYLVDRPYNKDKYSNYRIVSNWSN